MDLNDIRVAFTLTSLVLFLALVWHTWSRRRLPEHAAAAALPFDDDELAHGAAPVRSQAQGERGE